MSSGRSACRGLRLLDGHVTTPGRMGIMLREERPRCAIRPMILPSEVLERRALQRQSDGISAAERNPVLGLHRHDVRG